MLYTLHFNEWNHSCAKNLIVSILSQDNVSMLVGNVGMIKTHNNELRGQEETAIIMRSKMQPLGELFTRKSVQRITNVLLKPP